MPRVLALLGAALMPASLFFDWYEVEPGIFSHRSMTFGGWEVFEATDAVMVLGAIAVIALALAAPRYAGRVILAVGAIATTFIAVAMLDKPAILGLVDTPGLSLRIGAWLGLFGALLVLGAGSVALRERGV